MGNNTISHKKSRNKYYYFGNFKSEKMNKINIIKRIKLLKENLIAQFKDTATLNKEICEDFKYADGENI